MMSPRKSLSVHLLFLIFISGVGAQDGWSVIYHPETICALKGSTVIMGCTYTYPTRYTVRKPFWSKELVRPGYEPPYLSADPEYRGRVHYLGDKLNDCRLRLRDVRETDQRKYYFRFITYTGGGKYQGPGGVALSVTGLQVEGPERVMEGDNVTLTCKTSCRLTDRPSFTWYRNGASLSSRTEQLYLQRVSRKDAGRYRCAVLDQNLHSPEVSLNVLYPPKSVSVSSSPSGGIVEGGSVTLTCSSDGNPPGEYNWYKESSLVGRGKTFTLKKISSVNGGGYKCRSSNDHGVKYSDTVTLNVLYPPKSVSVSISPSGGIVEGSSVTLTCSSDGNPPVQKYTWFKKVDEGAQQKWTGQIYSITNIRSADSGGYQCMATNTHGSRYSEYKSLTVLWVHSSVLAAAVGVSAIGLLVIGIILFVKRKRRGDSTDEADQRQQNVYSTVGETFADSNSTPGLDPSSQEEVQYASVVPLRLRNAGSPAVNASSSGNDEEVQYARVVFLRTDASGRSTAPSFEDSSVIYSGVK